MLEAGTANKATIANIEKLLRYVDRQARNKSGEDPMVVADAERGLVILLNLLEHARYQHRLRTARHPELVPEPREMTLKRFDILGFEDL